MTKRASATIVCAILTTSACAQQDDATSSANPFNNFTSTWRNDPVWNDGLAEVAEYDATRDIYGVAREYTARLYTNKEFASPVTFTKADGGQRRSVFKHHLRDDIPTENYTYHYSTMCYVGATDLKSLKIDMGSQEDCGASFKQFVNHNGTVTWRQLTYFPQQGRREGKYRPTANFAYQDALSLVLRGYPFDTPRDVDIQLLPDQTTTRWSPVKPAAAHVTYIGRGMLDLPIGKVDAHHVRVVAAADKTQHDYWLHADGSAPLLHMMVQYRGPGGMTYRIRTVKREAYWRR